MAKKKPVVPVGGIGDAYDTDTQPTLRAAALLLEWAADDGNERVDGFIVAGIAHTLRLVAERMDAKNEHRAWAEEKRRELDAGRAVHVAK